MIRNCSSKIQTFEKKHIDIMRKIAPECMVLLKSDGLFPLDKVGEIALYGSGGRKTIKGGTGSGDVNVRKFVTVEEGLENAGFVVTTKDWLQAYDCAVECAYSQFVAEIKEKAKEIGVPAIMLGMGAVMPEPEYDFPLDGVGDTCIYVISRISGEGSDRNPVAGDINLTETEIRDVLTLNKKYAKFMLVLNVGGMIDLEPVLEVKNILVLSQLGSVTGDALADVILGRSYPSGKLTTTWTSIEQYGSTEGFGQLDDTIYAEDIYVGYRYFDTFGKTPLWAFGYGLGYTDFDIKVRTFEANEEKVTVTVSVTNRGKKNGKEVVQVYYSAPDGEIDKPYQELATYAKTKELIPGESQLLTLCYETRNMASYSEKEAAEILEKGTYNVRVGNSSRSTYLCGTIELDKNAVVRQLRNVGGKVDIINTNPERKYKIFDTKEEKKKVEKIKVLAEKIKKENSVYSNDEKELAGEYCTLQDVKEGKKDLDTFIGSLSIDELAYLCIGNYKDGAGGANVIGSASNRVAGAAGETTGRLKDRELDTLVMADGPAGLRLSPTYTMNEDGTCNTEQSLPVGFEDFMEAEELEMMAQMMAANGSRKENKQQYYQYCTALPVGTALAQSWNNDLCQLCGDVVGTEMELFGVQMWLAPALNIHRSPLCGRNYEYFSEDPTLSGKIAVAIINGVQSHKGCGATIKHFACNNQETNRYFSNSVLSERALREIYLKGFEICVKESKPKAVMTSYNLINGEHACNRKDLLTFVLRDEWGFDGIIMTDWLVTGGMASGREKYPAASAAGCVKAGNDITMPGSEDDFKDIMNAFEDKMHAYSLKKAELQMCAKRVIQCLLSMQ